MTKATNSPTLFLQGKDRLKSPVSQYKGIGKPLQGYATIGDIFDLMQGEQLKPLSTQLHNAKQESPQAYKRIKERDCPAFITGKFPKKEDAACEVYTGLVVFDIDHCVDDFCVAENIRMLKSSPFVFAAFPSVSGLGVRVMVWCDSKPETHKVYYEAFCAHLSEFLNIPTDKSLRATLKEQGKAKAEIDAIIEQIEIIDTSTNNIARIWFYSHVPSDLFYLNLDSHVYVLKDLQRPQSPTHPKQPKQPFIQLAISKDDRVKVALDKVHRQNIGTGRNNFVYAFASEMCRHGVPMDTALMECAAYEQSDFDQAEIKKTVKSAYDSKKFGEFQDGQIAKYKTLVNGQTKDGKQATPTAANDTPVKENPPQASGTAAQGKQKNNDLKLAQVEKELNRSWKFRYNTVTCTTEIEQGENWSRIDDFTLNSIVRKLKQRGIAYASKTRIAELLESDFCPAVNPIEEYFLKLPSPENRDYISELCKTVTPIAGDEVFRKYFEKWLVGAVANVFIKDRCANQLCFILSGKQGVFKSTWIRLLCPSQLSPYYIEGGLDPDDKDSMSATTTNFIFNLDDYFAGITFRKINEFKGLLTKNTVKIRRPYARYSEEMPKICSFIASSNEETFLHDPTGNRRFLPFEVTAIDIDAAQKIDINAVWAQAYHQYKSGFQYWLTKEEQNELAEHNTRFEVQSQEFEAVATYLNPPGKGEFKTAAQVLSSLNEMSGLKLSQKKLGEALKKAGFEREQRRRNNARVWGYVVEMADVPKEELIE